MVTETIVFIFVSFPRLTSMVRKKTSQILRMRFCIVLYIETITVSIFFFYITTIIVNDLVSFLNFFPLKSQYLLTAEKVLLVHVLYNHYVPATDYMCTCKDS